MTLACHLLLDRNGSKGIVTALCGAEMHHNATRAANVITARQDKVTCEACLKGMNDPRDETPYRWDDQGRIANEAARVRFRKEGR